MVSSPVVVWVCTSLMPLASPTMGWMVSADVVMTTAYDSYAVKAFEAGSVDYLLKPIDLKDLTRAVERCRSRQKPAFDLEALLAAVRNDFNGEHPEAMERLERLKED